VRIATLANASVIHTVRWVRYFRARGHEVRVWSLEPGPADLGVDPLPRLPLPGFVRYPLALPALKRALARFDPDLVDAHYVPNYGVLGALTGRRPLSVTAWGSDLLVVGARDPLQAARARFVLRRADAVFADSENLAEAALRLGAHPERVHTVAWGVDLAQFRPEATREAGLVVSTRMHEPIYDLATVIRGMKPVLETKADARLIVAGRGSLTASLERLAHDLLPAGRFQFVGRLTPDELAALLGRAQIYLSTSLSDSTSLSLLEAMASGAVPVVSDLEGNREWVGENQGARLFSPGDAAGLAWAVLRVLEDESWAAEARRRNRSVVEHRANYGANMGRIEALFEELVQPAPRRHVSAAPPGA
jgi:glycosyltransferase involved in cell wall biosynthesis